MERNRISLKRNKKRCDNFFHQFRDKNISGNNSVTVLIIHSTEIHFYNSRNALHINGRNFTSLIYCTIYQLQNNSLFFSRSLSFFSICTSIIKFYYDTRIIFAVSTRKQNQHASKKSTWSNIKPNMSWRKICSIHMYRRIVKANVRT